MNEASFLQALGFIEQRLMHINESLVIAVGDQFGGPTLRDKFAMAAMGSLLQNKDVDVAKHINDRAGRINLALASYELADAMLAARECDPALGLENPNA